MPKFDDDGWRIVGNPLSFQRPPSGIIRRTVGDTAVDALQGAIGFGQSLVGLSDLATLGLAGDALSAIGYDPQRAGQMVREWYSPERQEAERAVQEAEGFTGTVGALVENPSALAGRGVQSVPYLLGSMAAARRAAAGLPETATAAERSARGILAGSAAEGALTAGSVGQEIREGSTDPDRGRFAQYYGLPAGAMTSAIGYGAGRLMPSGQIENLLVPGARGQAGILRRAGAGAFSEGVLEEMPQSAQEQMFTNLGLGRDPMYRVPEAAGEGFITGTATGGVLGPFQRGAPPAPEQLLPGANVSTGTAPPGPPLQLGFSGYDTGVGPLVTFPDGSTMTRAEYERYVVNMPQGPDPLGAYVPERRFQYEGAIPFTPTDLLVPQGATRSALQVPLVRGQGDLFDPLMEGGFGETPTAVDAQPPAPTTETGALFQAYPSAMVRTEFGTPQITAALRQANGGKFNAQLGRFIPEFSRAIEQGPAAVDALIAKYDTAKSTLRPEVFETAAQMAQDYQSRLVNAMATEGLRRAQPGVTVGARPNYDASADAVAGTQERVLNQAAAERDQAEFTGALADTDARVQGAREQQSAQGRRSVLDTALEGSTSAGNARNRFIKALRKAGYRDTIVRPEEQQVIERYFSAAEAFQSESDQIQSAPNEMGDVVPERKAPETKKAGKPARQNENRSFRLTPPPSTEADLEALAKAQAKRERKAGEQRPSPTEEDTPQGKQGILFTKKGEPSAQATKEQTNAVQEPGAAPVSPRKGARAGQRVGEEVPGQGQAAAEGEAKPKKPRKAKVKAKIADQEVELEVDDADAKIAAMKKDIDMYESFIACLRKK